MKNLLYYTVNEPKRKEYLSYFNEGVRRTGGFFESFMIDTIIEESLYYQDPKAFINTCLVISLFNRVKRINELKKLPAKKLNALELSPFGQAQKKRHSRYKKYSRV